MKRFLSLLALVASPVMAMAADAQMTRTSTVADRMRDSCSTGPVSAMDESWASRTSLKIGFNKSSSAYYSLNTVQPLFRDPAMESTLFLQAGIGQHKWHRSTTDIGLGYRHLFANAENMVGVSLFYFDNTRAHKVSHGMVKKNGLGADISWYTPYTTLSLGRFHDVNSMKNSKAWKRFIDHNKSTTSLDLSFQVPFLPWTEFTIGKAWEKHHHKRWAKHARKHLDYGLTLNIAGPLAIEAGYHHGWNRGGYVNFVVNFGRPAVREHTLMDAFCADEAFTPRDLKNYTLDPVTRAVI